MFKPTFVTELGKNFSIYDLISFSGKTKENNKLDLIRPSDSLNFQLLGDIYKNSLTFELGHVHEKKSYSVAGDKVFNFAILKTKKNKNNRTKKISRYGNSRCNSDIRRSRQKCKCSKSDNCFDQIGRRNPGANKIQKV